jgi:hypothetical protein
VTDEEVEMVLWTLVKMGFLVSDLSRTLNDGISLTLRFPSSR